MSAPRNGSRSMRTLIQHKTRAPLLFAASSSQPSDGRLILLASVAITSVATSGRERLMNVQEFSEAMMNLPPESGHAVRSPTMSVGILKILKVYGSLAPRMCAAAESGNSRSECCLMVADWLNPPRESRCIEVSFSCINLPNSSELD